MIRHLRWAAPLTLLAPLLFIGLVVGLVVVLEEQPPPARCGGEVSVTVDMAGLPGEVRVGNAVYRGPQLAGAAAIARAGADAGVNAHGQTIGIMTSIGESTLTAVEHGDVAGPDSLGWFQQRDPWGPREVRLDAYASATMFFTGGRGGQKGLLDQRGWETLPPTIAAHRTQINADPYHYERFWDDAQAIYAAITGADVAVQPVSTAPCLPEGGQEVVVASGSWVRPTTGRLTSGFGPRWGAMHNGLDFGAPLGTPVVAAKDGLVTGVCKGNRAPCAGYGTLIEIQHGDGLVSRYAHSRNEDVFVTAGQVVKAGERISLVGNYGDSTGPHLHWELHQDGRPIDPAPFLRSVGVVL